MLALAVALTNATGADVSVADLIDSDGFVALTGALDVKGEALAEMCRGGPARLPRGTWRARTRSASAQEIEALVGGDAAKMLARSGLAEDRLAQRLGVSKSRLAAASSALWGRTFSDERDRRAGPEANAQKRGQVSRQLQGEIERALNDGNH